MSAGLLILLILIVIPLIYVIVVYNRLITHKNRVKNAWSQIDVQLNRRYDLIPNLVEAVKGYMKHESETLERVIQARAAAMGCTNVAQKSEADNVLTGTLKSLFAVAEQYPNLKADKNVMQLQEELTSTENRISFARQHYNDSTMEYNIAIQAFPGNIIAGMFGFTLSDFFAVDDVKKEVPKVKF